MGTSEKEIMSRISALYGNLSPSGIRSFGARAVFFYLAILVILNYAVLALWYVGLDNYFSFVEPNVVSIAWAAMQGQPMYHGPDAAEQYSVVYGPYLFLITGWVLKLLGPGIASSKLAGALFALLSVLGMAYAVKRISDTRTGVIAGGFLVLTYFSFWPFSTFIARADAFLLGLAGLALAGAHSKNKWAGIVICALALGVAVSIKMHAAMYFLPIWVVMAQRFGWPSFFLAGGGAAVVALLPFIGYGNVSISNFIGELRTVADFGMDLHVFLKNMRTLLSIQLLPVVMVLSILPAPLEILKRHKLFLAASAVSLTATMAVASVVGAGKTHLIPLSIAIIYWLAVILKENYGTTIGSLTRVRGSSIKHGIIYFLLTLMLLSIIPADRRMFKLMNYNGRFNGAVADIQNIISANPGKTIGMGDGEQKDNALTAFRPLLVFAGNPYLLDAVVFMVKKGAGRSIGPQTVKAVSDCRIDIWLVPKGNIPYAINSVFDGGNYLYDAAFRKAFLDNYRPKAQSEYYDLWHCKDS